MRSSENAIKSKLGAESVIRTPLGNVEIAW
jgi:hypothetical protein